MEVTCWLGGRSLEPGELEGLAAEAVGPALNGTLILGGEGLAGPSSPKRVEYGAA